MLFRYLNGAQLCRKHRQHHFGVYLCAQPLQCGICQTHRLPRLCALHRGAGAAAQTCRCHSAEIGQQGGGDRFILFVGGKQHGGGVAVARLRGPGQFFGSMQHGLPDLKIARVPEDLAILLDAHKAAEATLLSQGDLDFIRPILALQYKERFAHIMEN